MRDKLRFSVEKSLRSHKKEILLIILTASLTLVIGSTISIWLSEVGGLDVPSIGRIRVQGVEAYWDGNLENEAVTLDWGTVYPGASKDLVLYLQSISNIETTLDLRAANWTFRDSDNAIVAGPNDSSPYMHLTWSYSEKTIVHPGEIVLVTLTLSVDSSSHFFDFLIANDVKDFALDITISTSEHRD